MKRVIPIILLVPLLFGRAAFAQKDRSTVKGRIVNADGSPAYVTIELEKLKKMTVTDVNGNFNLRNLPESHDTLIITSVESRAYELPVAIGKNQISDLGEIKLAFNISQLQYVEVRGRTAHSYKSDYSFLGAKTQAPSINIPQSISSITKEMIKDRMELTLKDAADQAAGVNQYSGYDEYAIRGFRADNARLINGLRGYNSTYTSPMLVNIERVEVVKGPTATLYGNCDPGGTINLVTKKPLDRTTSDFDLYGGSWDHFRGQADITGPLTKNKILLYRFNAGYDNGRSFRDHVFSRSYAMAPSLSFMPNEKLQVNVDLSLSHISTLLDRGQPGFLNDATLKSTPVTLSVSQPGDYLQETDLASIITFCYKISKHLSFSSGYLHYLTWQHVADHGLNDYITPDSVHLYYTTWSYHTVTNTLTNYFSYECKIGKISQQLLTGYDFIQSKVNLDQQYYEIPDQFGAGSGIVGTFSLRHPSYYPRPVSTYQISDYGSDATDVDGNAYHTQGFYVQDQVSVNRWKLLLSLREEIYKGDQVDSGGNLMENLFLPRIGIVYLLRTDLSLYATYNNGFDPFEASTSTQVFKDPFKPIISELLEAGAKANFFNNKLSTSIALYQLTLRNVAMNADIISNPNLFIQQGKDGSRGIETEADGNILPNLSIAISYSYCLARVLQSKIPSQIGTIVENAPKNTSSTWIKYMFHQGPLKGLGFAVGHAQASARNTLDPNIILPGYIVVNAGIRFVHKHFNSAINLNNVTNTTYWTGAYNNVSKWPGMPRNYMINIGYQF